MEIYKLGPDELNERAFKDLPGKDEDVEWIVYWYEQSYYEGYGHAVWKNVDGTFGLSNLSHCSDYGPLDTNPPVSGSLEDILRELGPVCEDDYDYVPAKPVRDKVLELVDLNL